MVFIYIKINTELFWKGMSNVKKKKKKKKKNIIKLGTLKNYYCYWNFLMYLIKNILKVNKILIKILVKYLL